MTRASQKKYQFGKQVRREWRDEGDKRESVVVVNDDDNQQEK